MSGQGFRQQGANWTRNIDQGTRASGNPQEIWSPEYARMQFNQNGQMNLADQAMQAAGRDYNQLSDILEGQNQDRAQFQNDLIGQQNRLEQDRLGSMDSIREQTEAGARQIEQSAQASGNNFDRFRDEQISAMEAHTEKVRSMAMGVVDGYSDRALGSISAGAAGIAQSTQSEVKDIEAQGRAQGLSEDMIASMTFQARGRGMQQMQSAIAPMIDQKNQIKAQLGMAATGLYADAVGREGQIRGQAMALTEQSEARRQQAAQQAAQYRMAGRLQAVQANATYHNAQIALGQQRAMALRDLTQKFPSQFDSILQAAFGLRQFERRNAINFNNLGVA